MTGDYDKGFVFLDAFGWVPAFGGLDLTRLTLGGPALPEPAPNRPDQGPADEDEAQFERELDEQSRDEIP